MQVYFSHSYRDIAINSYFIDHQNMAFTHTYKGVGECHPYREFEGMQPSR